MTGGPDAELLAGEGEVGLPDNSQLWEVLPCNVGCSAVSLAYTHRMPAASIPRCDSQKHFRHCHTSPGGKVAQRGNSEVRDLITTLRALGKH